MKNDIIDVQPISSMAVERDEFHGFLYYYRLPTTREGGIRLFKDGKPVMASEISFSSWMDFFWRPFPESDLIGEMVGEGISADGRYKYPDRNKWGVVMINDGSIWNLKDDLSKVYSTNIKKDIIVNVNDLKGGYLNNTGQFTLTMMIVSP